MARPALPTKGPIALWTNQAMTDDTETYTSAEIVNNLGYGRCVISLMADTEVGTATLDAKVQYYNEVEAAWVDVPGASLAQITANQTTPTDLVIGVGLTAVANRVVSQPVHKRMRVHITIGDATTEGFTVSAEYTLYA